MARCACRCGNRSMDHTAGGGCCVQELHSAGGKLVSFADDWSDEQIKACNRSAVEVSVSDGTIQSWLSGTATSGTEEDQSTASGCLTRLRLFSGNDYLGLSSHPAVRAAAAQAAMEYGMGPRASPLVCGYTEHHRELERALAELKGTEDCLLFPSGFAANMGVVTAICSPSLGDQAQPNPPSMVAIFSDELNHASIIDGVRLAQRTGRQAVTAHVYRHCDMTHLEQLLSASSAPRKVVVTDSLFSMDGDFAPLAELAVLRRKHGFLLVVDEAHATLVCGHRGGGAAEAFGVADEVDLHVGTLSKAVGCHGGFVATSRKWKQWILSRGRSFVYSTAQPIPTVAAALAALVVARREPWRQRHVWALVDALSAALGVPFTSPIISVVIGGAKEALDASNELLRRGFHVPAIRPPTVPEGSSRLRIALSAAHTFDDVAALVDALSPLLKKGRSPASPSGVRYDGTGPAMPLGSGEIGVNEPEFLVRGVDFGVNGATASDPQKEFGLSGRDPTIRKGGFDADGLAVPLSEGGFGVNKLQASGSKRGLGIDGSRITRGEIGVNSSDVTFRGEKLDENGLVSICVNAAAHGADTGQPPAGQQIIASSTLSTHVESTFKSVECRRELVEQSSSQQATAGTGKSVGVSQVSQHEIGRVIALDKKIRHRQTESLSWSERSQGDKPVTDALEATHVSSIISQRSRL
ncbi:7-keto-8-aminopelargonic acid synthase [Klebsormidium nitens]|uniref:7-keto-8-aminopelargonic acid synthase n=1 Tax=Klebsormidium nitens TaxID=105231 RepID=A0A0U9HTP9_KLENI|nr:7-keto-8-aminopelargonic acid synthase [Klebsormidium nitens]|eukprot:GAQ79440.1 7-keto-8-aminopelargonic acid synthase [Klebsormidium nitens]